MNWRTGSSSGWPARLGLGLGLGLVIALADNTAFEGEVSPIVIVAMLFGATAWTGTKWGFRGWAAAATTWSCIPSAHVLKRTLGLHDTLHPNTYASILMLAAFTLAIGLIGLGSGILIRRLLFDNHPRPSVAPDPPKPR